MNQNRSRKGGRSQKHLRNSNKGFGNSNSANWREHKSNGSNEPNSFGYNNQPLTSAFITLVGVEVQLQKSDGDIYEGILETVSPKVEISLSHATKIGGLTANGVVEPVCERMVFPFRDVVYCKAANVDLDFGKLDGLQIDSEITNRPNGPTINRELVQWKDGDAADSVAAALEDLEVNGTFDVHEMLRVNEEQHGVKSTYDISMADYMTPIEKTNSETYREQERRAEKLAREMQNDPSYKDIDTADSGFGEEEMFSSVVRPSPPVNNTPSHIAKSSSSPSNLVNNATNSNNNNNINLNNNNNSSNNNNDGFTMYSSRKSSRGSKSQDQPVGPRFRNRASTQDTSNGSNHAPVSRSYSTGTSHRSYTSSNQRNNVYSHQHHHAVNNNQVNLHQNPSADSHVINNNQTKHDVYPPASVSGLTYSAVMKKTNQKSYPPNNIVPGPKGSPTGQPIPHQSSEKHKSGSPSNQPQHPPNRSVAPPEALAAAKAQIIHNSKNYASSATHISKTQFSSVATTQNEPIVSYQTSAITSQKHTSNNSQQSQNPSRQTLLQSTASPIASVTTQQALPKIEVPDKKVLEQKMEAAPSIDGLSKFGKIIHKEEEKEKPTSGSELKKLKEFSETFKLSESTHNIKKSASKSADIPKCPGTVAETEKNEKSVPVSKKASSEIETKVLQETPIPTTTSIPKSVSTTISQPFTQPQSVSETSASVHEVNIATTTAVSTVSTVITATTESSIPSREAGPNAASKKSSLNPDAKSFTFNPSATPFSPKTTVSRQTSYPGLQTQASIPTAVVGHAQSQYYNVHSQPGGAPVFVNTTNEMITAHQMPSIHPIKQYYTPRPQATVFSIPAGEFNQNPNGQPQVITPTQSGYIPQTIPNQGQHVYLVQGPNGMQQIIPQGQQVFPVQPVQASMIRYVSHTGAAHMPHQASRVPPSFPQQDGVGYVIASQHANGTPHQTIQANQPHSYPTPSPSPSPHMGGSTSQPYGINQPHPPTNYPQMTSPVTHNQASVYRPPTPLSSQQHHQTTPQQPFVMMAATGAPHANHNLQNIQMATNNQMMHGQHAGGIMPQYQQQGN